MTVSVLDWERRYRRISQPSSPAVAQSTNDNKQEMTIDEFVKKQKGNSTVLGISRQQFRSIAQEWQLKNL